MKYLKLYENYVGPISFYEKDEEGRWTNYFIVMMTDEYEKIKNDLIKFEDHSDTGGSKLYYFNSKDRETIQNKLELIRTAKKYNL